MHNQWLLFSFKHHSMTFVGTDSFALYMEIEDYQHSLAFGRDIQSKKVDVCRLHFDFLSPHLY